MEHLSCLKKNPEPQKYSDDEKLNVMKSGQNQ